MFMKSSISCLQRRNTNAHEQDRCWWDILLCIRVIEINQVITQLITTVRDCLCVSTWLWSHLRGFPVYSSCSSLRAGSWAAMMGCRSLLSSQCVTPLSHHRQLRNTHRRHVHWLCVSDSWVSPADTLWLRAHQRITPGFVDSWGIYDGRNLIHSLKKEKREPVELPWHIILNFVGKCVPMITNLNTNTIRQGRNSLGSNRNSPGRKRKSKRINY